MNTTTHNCDFIPQLPDQSLCKFYNVSGYQDLVKALVRHVELLQDSAKRNVKPWEDTFPPTLLPSYIERIKKSDVGHKIVTADEIERVKEILEKIQRWHGEFPEAPLHNGKPQSYGAAFGSNGERDYMRGMAGYALSILSPKEIK